MICKYMNWQCFILQEWFFSESVSIHNKLGFCICSTYIKTKRLIIFKFNDQITIYIIVKVKNYHRITMMSINNKICYLIAITVLVNFFPPITLVINNFGSILFKSFQRHFV